MSPFSKANSPGSVGSNVCRARTRVTMADDGAAPVPYKAEAEETAVEEGEGLVGEAEVTMGVAGCSC